MGLVKSVIEQFESVPGTCLLIEEYAARENVELEKDVYFKKFDADAKSKEGKLKDYGVSLNITTSPNGNNSKLLKYY